MKYQPVPVSYIKRIQSMFHCDKAHNTESEFSYTFLADPRKDTGTTEIGCGEKDWANWFADKRDDFIRATNPDQYLDLFRIAQYPDGPMMIEITKQPIYRSR